MHHPSPGTAGKDTSSFQGLEQETPGCVAELSLVFVPEAVAGARVGQFWWQPSWVAHVEGFGEVSSQARNLCST